MPVTPSRRNDTAPSAPPSYEEDPGLASIKVVACDMDLTLLADDKSMPEGIEERISALAGLGVPFAAASGRPAYTLEAAFPRNAADMAFIADNGGLVTYRGRTIFKDLLDPAAYRAFCQTCLNEAPDAVPVVCGLERAYALKRHAAFDSLLRVYYLDIAYLDTFDGLEAEADKATILFPGNDSRRYYDEVFAPRFGGEFYVTCSGVEWIDFMNKGVNKGLGVAKLCEHVGVALKDAAAFGDTDNDAPMLDAVGHSFLVANASEHMYPHARYLAPSNNEAGVVQVLDAILDAKKSVE